MQPADSERAPQAAGQLCVRPPKTRIKWIRHRGELRYMRCVNMPWVDQQVIRLGQQNGPNHEHRSLALCQPTVAPCSRDGDAARPIGWQRRLVNRQAGHGIRNV